MPLDAVVLNEVYNLKSQVAAQAANSAATPIGSLLPRATGLEGPITLANGMKFLPCNGSTFAVASYPELMADPSFSHADLTPFVNKEISTVQSGVTVGTSIGLFTKIGTKWTDNNMQGTGNGTWALCTTLPVGGRGSGKQVVLGARMYLCGASVPGYTNDGSTFGSCGAITGTTTSACGYNQTNFYQAGRVTATPTTCRIADYLGTTVADVTGLSATAMTWLAGNGSSWLMGNGATVYRLGQDAIVGGALGGVWTSLGAVDPGLAANGGYVFMDCVAGKYVFAKVAAADTTYGGGLIQFAITADGTNYAYRTVSIPPSSWTKFLNQGTSVSLGQASISCLSSMVIAGRFYCVFQGILITTTDADTFSIAFNFAPLLGPSSLTSVGIGIDQSGNMLVVGYYSTSVYTFTGNTSAPDYFTVRKIAGAGLPYYMMRVA